jgi:membrane-bound metal-dependent hydrolase YbcI (DUF457 family)
MFVGHYGVAFAARRTSPRLSLALLFIAVQFLDVLFAVFVLFGIEKLRIVHGFTSYNPYDLYWMPYTHSLVGALVWSALAGWLFWMAARRLPSRERRLASVVLGSAVFSHFVLDFPMHTPDLPLWPGTGAPKVGLGLWNHRFAAIFAELAVLIAGGWIYVRGSRARSNLARIGTVVFSVFLVALTVATPFQPDPTSPQGFAIFALVAYVALAVVAGLVDRDRAVVEPRERRT